MNKFSTITAVDVGTASVKVMIAKKNSEGTGFDVLGKAENISSGMKYGGVNDVEKVSKVIARTVLDAKREAGVEVDEVYANINGGHIFSIPSSGTITTSHVSEEISEEDVERAINGAKTFSLPQNKEIIYTIPKFYTVDGEGPIKSPIGLSGVRLTVDIIVVGVFASYLRWLTDALLKADLEVNDLIVEPIATAKAVLTTEEKELGVVAVNLGAATTAIAVYKDEQLLLTKVIPVGVHHIRNDIATGLQVDIETAELIKKKYGNSIFGDRRTGIERIKTAGGEEISFPKNKLRKIMEERIVQIFTAVREEIEVVCPRKELPGGVVLTGGGAKIVDIKDFVRDKVGLACRVGLPRRFFNLDKDPSYTTLCGLILHGAEMEEEEEGRTNFKNFFNRLKKLFKPFLP